MYALFTVLILLQLLNIYLLWRLAKGVKKNNNGLVKMSKVIYNIYMGVSKLNKPAKSSIDKKKQEIIKNIRSQISGGC